MVVSGGLGKRSDVPIEDDTWVLEMRTLLWRPIRATNFVIEQAATTPTLIPRLLEMCPFITRQSPCAVPTQPVSFSKAAGKTFQPRDALPGPEHNSAPQFPQVTREGMEGSVLLGLEDRVIFFGGRDISSGKMLAKTAVLDLITERWVPVRETMIPAPDGLQEKQPAHLSSLPAYRWAHCGAAWVEYCTTLDMGLARTLSELSRETNGAKIMGAVRFTDDRATQRYIEAMREAVDKQAKFSGILFTRYGRPLMARMAKAVFFGGSGGGSGGARRIELDDAWTVSVKVV